MARHKEHLPEPLPAEPLALVAQWLSEAQRANVQPNANAMVLATVDAHGAPSARVVLCKEIRPDTGYITFYTNYLSRKGAELSGNARAAAVMYWDVLHRQVRLEGVVTHDHDGRERHLFRIPRLAEPHRRLGQPAEQADRLALGTRARHRADGPALWRTVTDH